MTFPQRITRFLGQNTGFRQKVYKWLRKKRKLNPTSSEESNKTLKQTPSQDLVSDSYAAYREAAKSDDYMFGNYDAYKAYEEYGDIPD